jgi:hypothetical protein
MLGDPLLQEAGLPPDLAGRIHELRARAQQAALAKRQAIVNSLLENQRSTFVELFDASVVADICRQFRHHQPVVSQWVEAEILPASRIGFAADSEQAVSRDDQGRLSIRWTWPPPRFTQRCHLRICSKPPAEHTLPTDVPAEYATVIARDEWDPEQGCSIEMDPSWEECRVYVWAELDLGYQVFFSTPFEVGQIQPQPKQRRWSLFRRGRRQQRDGQPPEEPAAEDTSSQRNEEPDGEGVADS